CQARRVLKTEELATLISFREELYNSLGLRQDSLFELMDGCGVDRIAPQHVGAAQPDGSLPPALAEHLRRAGRWIDRCGCVARAGVDADLLVRWTKSRVVYRPPVKRPGRGRPRLHGTPFRLTDKRTHGKPRQSAQLDHPLYGKVQIDAWSDLHVRNAPDGPF